MKNNKEKVKMEIAEVKGIITSFEAEINSSKNKSTKEEAKKILSAQFFEAEDGPLNPGYKYEKQDGKPGFWVEIPQYASIDRLSTMDGIIYFVRWYEEDYKEISSYPLKFCK